MKVGLCLPFSKVFQIVLMVLAFFAGQPVAGASSVNAIKLAVSPKAAKVKQKIMLTARVTTNQKAATGGTVTFFDGKLPLSNAQVVGNKPAKGYTTGNATLTTILGPGAHSLTALYAGTAKAPGRVTSNPVHLNVTGATGSMTVLTAKHNAKNSNNYDFTSTVQGFGFSAPTGKVDFADITSKTDLGKAALGRSATQGFGTAMVTGAAGSPTQTVVADFNGDGFPDVATPDAAFGPSSLVIFLGKANGQFEAPISYPAAYFASSIVAGDFNNDGILDLAVMSQGDSGSDGVVALFLGNGDGSFQSPLSDVIGGLPVSITLGDFNRDGILDFASTDYFANTASVSIGNGDGTFQAPVAYGVGSGPYFISGGDFNNDGFQDLTVVNDNDSTVSVLLGKGDGTFRTQKTYGTGLQVEYVTAADLNADGNQDLIVANYAAQNVGVLLGNGDGTFKTQVTYPVGGYDSGIAVGDLNGDGIPDLAVSYYQPPKLGVLIGKGDGTFAAVKDYDTGQAQGFEVTIADLDGDGTPDLISSDIHASLSVLLSGTYGTAKLADVAVPGTSKDTERIVAKYPGDSHYKKSKSAAIRVKGSGAE
jgi:hypothetical protein